MLFTAGVWKRNPERAAIPASIDQVLRASSCWHSRCASFLYFELPGKLVPFKKLPDVSKWRLRLNPLLVTQKQITFNLSSDVLLLKNGPEG